MNNIFFSGFDTLQLVSKESWTYKASAESEVGNLANWIDGLHYDSEFAHSADQNNPWYQIDMQEELIVFGLGVHIRLEVANRMDNVEVRVGNVDETPNVQNNNELMRYIVIIIL